jgi:hypothetical protein
MARASQFDGDEHARRRYSRLVTLEQKQRVIVACAAGEGLALVVAWWLKWSPLGIGLVVAAGMAVSVAIVMLQRRG